MKKYIFLLTSFTLILLYSCTENIDTSARYVFKADCVMTYLEKHEAYSEYVKLLKLTPISIRSKSTVGELLTARGHYTVFAPTNKAITSPASGTAKVMDRMTTSTACQGSGLDAVCHR